MRLALLAFVAASAWAWPAAAQDRSVFSALELQGRVGTDGAPARGTLSSEDLIASGGRRIQVWALDAAPGAALQVDLSSGDFDAYVYVVGPGLGEGLTDDDGGDGLNARVCVVVDDPGEYRVVASSLSSATGGYTLQVAEREGVTDGACPEGELDGANAVDNIALLPTDDRVLRVGVDAEGALSSADQTLYGAPAQAWAFEGSAGQRVSFDLLSDDFDAYLLAYGPGLEDGSLDNDDGAGGCNARVTVDALPETGSYRFVASTLGAGAGSYRIVVSEEPGPRSDEPCVPSSDTLEPERNADAIAVVGSLRWESTLDGTLTGSEAQYDGKLMQGWTLEGDAGARIAVEMRSSDFDSYLYLTGPGFEDPESNDDGADNLNSRLCVELPESGAYRVLAGPYSGGESGQLYTIRASRADAETLCEGTFARSAGAMAGLLAELPTEGRTLRLGEEAPGLLDPADPRHPETDHPIQAWSFQGETDRTVYVDVISEEFDAVLYAVGTGIDGVLFIDDGDAGCNSRMSITPSASGAIVLLPGAYSTEASGAFRLRASEDPPPLEDNSCDFGDSDASATVADAEVLVGMSSGEEHPMNPMEWTTVASDSLRSDGEHLASGVPAQAWTVTVLGGEELEITLISEAFDPILYVDGPSISPPLMDDDSAGDLDSRIVYTPPEDGVLRLVVSAYDSAATGAFELRIVRRTP